jgi:hypothetical protein
VFVHRAGVVLRAAADLKGVAAVLLEEGPFGLTWELDEPMALERALALGRPAAVLQLLDRHNRDCAALAERLDVPHLTLPDALPDTPFEVIPLVDTRFWREVALWWAEPRVLVVAEAIGTAPAYAVGRMGAGVHIGLRLRPPRRLAAYEPEHLLVGHGPALHGPRATAALHEALGRSRRDLPRAAIALPRALVKVRH